VVAAAEDSDITISDLSELGTNDEITSVAIGEPNTVPAGKYATQALQSAGLLEYTTADDGTITITDNDFVTTKLNAGADKVGTVASYVKEGQCDVGLVYSSDIYRYDGIKAIYTVPADMHKDIVYPGAVCSSSENAEVAQDFLDFCMNDADAQQIFSEYGFELAA
jgi:molybdate transport system substrate-binding protein